MLTTILAYFMIGLFVVMDVRARQSAQAKSLVRGEYDRGSTVLVAATFGISALMLLVAPLLNHFRVGAFGSLVV